jgi:hypothetical protein
MSSIMGACARMSRGDVFINAPFRPHLVVTLWRFPCPSAPRTPGRGTFTPEHDSMHGTHAAGERRPTGTDTRSTPEPALWAVRSSGLLDAGAVYSLLLPCPCPLAAAHQRRGARLMYHTAVAHSASGTLHACHGCTSCSSPSMLTTALTKGIKNGSWIGAST